MSVSSITSVVIAVCVVTGLVVALIGWFFKRGGTEREMTLAVKDNTKSNRELSTALHELKSFAVERLHEHDLHLTKLDGRVDKLEEANDSRTPDRNPGPA